jgi:hypothetical protein
VGATCKWADLEIEVGWNRDEGPFPCFELNKNLVKKYSMSNNFSIVS